MCCPNYTTSKLVAMSIFMKEITFFLFSLEFVSLCKKNKSRVFLAIYLCTQLHRYGQQSCATPGTHICLGGVTHDKGTKNQLMKYKLL